VKKAVPVDSFFNFFTPPQPDDEDAADEDADEEDQEVYLTLSSPSPPSLILLKTYWCICLDSVWGGLD
jgi:hypothetical protein